MARTSARRATCRAPVVLLATAVLTATAICTTLGGVASASALAGPPQVESVQSGQPSATSLTIDATIDPEAQATSYHLEYGTTPSHESSTPPKSAGSGSSPVRVTVKVTGLSPGTRYDVELVVENASGSITSPSLVLETLPSASGGPGTGPASTAPTAPTPPTTPTTTAPPPPTEGVPPTSTTNATAFTRQRFPSGTAASGELGAVSCPRASLCFAVGSSGPVFTTKKKKVSTFSSLVARRSDERWSLPGGRAVHEAELTGISCASASDCVAVGRAGEPSSHPFAQHWDGKSWALSAVPAASIQGNGVALFSVSCATARSCVAVGGSDLGTTAAFPIFARWNGAAWGAVSPISAPATSYLSGVSCSSATACWAVGYSSSGALVEHFDDDRWSQAAVTGVQRGAGLELASVSCRTASACWAVGSDGSGQPLILKGGHGAWKSVAGARALAAQLESVTCASPTDCWAVGSASVPGATRSTAGDAAFAEHYDGTSWRAARVPAVSSKFASLSSISCRATACTAVGSTSSGKTQSVLVEVTR